MKPAHRRLAAAAALSAVTLSLAAPAAQAITVARVTRHGYILTDDPDSDPIGAAIPVTNARDMYAFIANATAALEEVEGFHEGTFLATMQLPPTQDPLAFYSPIRNDVRGIGQRAGDGRTEVFDNNRAIGTSFTLDGFLYLNSLRFYTDPRSINFGRYLICTQEFGHRFGARIEIGPYPGGVPDGGVSDGSVATDATAGVDASLPTDVPAMGDASATDGALADGAALPPGPLTRDALLGRGNTVNGMVVDRAHWSYFFNTGGSPMEGNLWAETSPGTFQTQRPSFRFSDFDLYIMGLTPASSVRPSFLIAEPTAIPRNVTRDSAPEYQGRTVTLRGRRVPVTIDDVVAANGVRSPAYPNTQRDLDVVWVLWVTPEQVTDDLAEEFDQAIESCALGFDTASGNLSRLISTTPFVEPPDAGFPDAGLADAGSPDAGFPDVGTPDAVAATDAASDAAGDAADATTEQPHAAGGCACSTSTRATTTRGGGWALGLGLAFAVMRRRRRAGRGRAVVPSAA